MKKTLFLFLFALISFLTNAQIKVLNNNKMGFGTLTPRYAIDIVTNSNSKDTIMIGKYGRGNKLSIEMLYNSVNPSNVDYAGFNMSPMCYPYLSNLGTSSKRWGNIYLMNAPDIVSDERLKTDITPLKNGVLEKITSLVPISYKMKDSIFGYEVTKEDKERTIVGLSAQRVKEVFPDVVDENEGIMGIKYSALIPYLIQAIKEQNEEIVRLKEELSNETTPKNNEIEKVAVLYQNEPNPFDKETYIKAYIPKIFNSAYLYIYDLNGTQKKSISIEERGETNNKISAFDLTPGMYYYSLICDNKQIDTKKMILTK